MVIRTKKSPFGFLSRVNSPTRTFPLRKNQPSLIHIQALTDCVIWKLSKQDLADYIKPTLNINKIARIVLEDALCRKITRETLLLGSSAEAIYEDLNNQRKRTD